MLNGGVDICDEAIPDQMNVGDITTDRRGSTSYLGTANESFLKEHDTRVMAMYVSLECSKFRGSGDAACIPRDDVQLQSVSEASL